MAKSTEERIAELTQQRDALAAAQAEINSIAATISLLPKEQRTRAEQCLIDSCGRTLEPVEAILAARLAKERQAGAVEALRTFGKHLERLGIEHVDEAAGCAIEAMALEAEVFAAQIERGEGE